jgi:uncharacterized protein with PIN domain
MFERFTERSRRAVALAQDEARELRHNYLGTEHLLLGLLREDEGLAARVLDTQDVTLEEARAQVSRIVGRGADPVRGGMPFTPRAKQVLELAFQESRSLGHTYIGTEHILLGLVSENQGVGARILQELGADAAAIRNETMKMLSGPSRRTGADATDTGVIAVSRAGSVGGQRYDQTHRLLIACPRCAIPIEALSTDRRNAHLQVALQGDHTCPGCGRRWALAVTAAWTDPSPSRDPEDDLGSEMSFRHHSRSAHFTMGCFRCNQALERVTLHQPAAPSVHIEAEGDRTCPSCGKLWRISYAVTWEARTA